MFNSSLICSIPKPPNFNSLLEHVGHSFVKATRYEHAGQINKLFFLLYCKDILHLGQVIVFPQLLHIT